MPNEAKKLCIIKTLPFQRTNYARVVMENWVTAPRSTFRKGSRGRAPSGRFLGERWLRWRGRMLAAMGPPPGANRSHARVAAVVSA
jgi:hypothetical protein